jgi:hypothetical protein
MGGRMFLKQLEVGNFSVFAYLMALFPPPPSLRMNAFTIPS